MEVLTVCIFLTVPVIAIASLIIGLLNAKKIATLKKLTAEAVSLSKAQPEKIQQIMMESL